MSKVAKDTSSSKMGPDRQTEEDPNDEGSSERDVVMPQMVVATGDDSSEEDASDEDEEGAGPMGDGYMLLPSADLDIDAAENTVMDDDDFPIASSNQQQQQQQHHHHQQQQQQPELPSHLAKLMPSEAPGPDPSTVVSFTDTAKSLEERRQVMAADDDIRKAMAGFSLPGTAIPPWAKALEDKDWQEQLSKMIRGREEKRQGPGGASREDKS